MKGHRAQGGFTLMEVLIAATLLSVMLVIITGTLRVGADSWNAGEERMAKASRLFIVGNFLRTHLGAMLPLAGTIRNGQMEPAFRGGRDTLAYVAAMPEQVRAAGIFRFELYLSKNGDTQDLRVAIKPYQGGPDTGETAETVDDLALVEGVRSLKLAYLSRREPAGSLDMTRPQIQRQEWQEEWTENQLPAAIRIDLAPEGEDPWPSLFIAPRTLMLR
jgi:general secretion pathway protein J